MTKFKRCLSAFLAFVMVFGMFSGMGNVFAPEAAAEEVVLGGNDIKTYAELNAAYDMFVYLGVEVYEVANGQRTDGKVEAGQWLEYRETILSDHWVGNITTAQLYDERFFDLTRISTVDGSSALGSTGYETGVTSTYSAGGNHHFNESHPMVDVRVPTVGFTSNACTNMSYYTNGTALIDESVYTNLAHAQQVLTFDASVSADALDMRTDTWFVKWYVKVQDEPTITETTSYAPKSIYKITPMNGTSTTAGDSRAPGNVPIYPTAAITGAETDIPDRTACKNMNVAAVFKNTTFLNEDTYVNFEIEVAEEEPGPVEGTSRIKSYAELNAAYDMFVYLGVDVYELEVENGVITQNYGLTDGYVKAGQWLEYRETILSDHWVGNITTAQLYDERFFDLTRISTVDGSSALGSTGYETGVTSTYSAGGKHHFNESHPMVDARVPTVGFTSNACTNMSYYTNGTALIDESVYTNLAHAQQVLTFDASVSADALDMRTDAWFVKWYVKVLDEPTITETTSYAPKSIYKITPMNGTSTTAGDSRAPGNVPIYPTAAITGEETDIPDRTACKNMNVAAVFKNTTFLNEDTYVTLKIGNPPAEGSEYTAKFVVDGSTVSEAKYAEGAAITVPENPSKDGYSFKGWSTDGTAAGIVTEFVMGTADVTYTAVFEEVVKYTATFVVDGSTVSEAQYATGEAIVAPDAPSKTGYNFAGWSPAVGTMGNSNVTFTAQWTAKTYTVNYYKNKGDATAHATLTVDYNAAYSTPSDPSQTGYKFVKWVDENGNDMAATHTVDADINFYASWDKNSYDAIFDANGGSFASGTSITVSTPYGDAIVAPAEEPTRTGYTFGGWEGFVEGATMGAASVTYKAIWNANSIGVHFIVDGEDTLVQGDFGSQISAIPNPSKEGYTFKGWADTEGATVANVTFPITLGAEDVYVYAVWEGNDITLNFYGETENDWYAYTILKAGAELVVPDDAAAPSKTGYKFVGYFDAEGNAMPATVPSKDTNYFAKFEAETYTATFVDGEETVGTYEGTYNSTIVLPEEPTKEGYTFAGWEGYTTGMKMPAADKTFTAKWTINKYAVIYYVDGEEVYRTEVEYGAVIPEYTYVPEDSGVSFGGWTTEIPATMPANELKIYGSTGKNTFNVTFTINGENPQVVPFEYGAVVVAPEYTVPEGYTFSGWDVPATMPAENITIDATLTANTYTAYFWLDEAMQNKYTEVKTVYGEAIEVPTPPQVDGKNFIEWDPKPTTMGAGDMNFIAVFEDIEYFVTFYNEDGSAIDGYDYMLYWGKEVTAEMAPEMSKTGYDFAGWYYEDGTKAVFPITVEGDIDLTAKFTVQGHKVFYYVDGAEYDYDAYEFGAAVTLRAPLTKEGYTFSGWKDADGNDAVLPEAMPEYDITVYGTWTINTYNAIFVGENGWTETVPTNYNAVPAAPTAPEKAGYAFAGWKAADGKVYAADALPAMGAADATYEAVYSAGDVTYTIETYTMGIDGEYGAAVVETKNGATDSEVSISPVADTGFTLSDDSVLSGVVAADGSTTLKIYFIRNQYTFKTVVDGVETDATYYYEAAVTAPEAPVKEGYTFTGWDGTVPATMPANDVTVTAKFQINQYTITFDTVGGSAVGAIKGDYATAVKMPADPTKTGYTFGGWAWTNTDTGAVVDAPASIPAYNVTATAQWTINQYTITFVDTGDVPYEDLTLDYNTAVSVADPMKTGYTFLKWNPAIPENMPAENITVTATWKVNQYPATFIVDGVSEVVMTNFGEIPVAPAAPAKVGHKFAGWDNELVAMGVDGATYTATWEVLPYDAIFDANGGAWADGSTTKTDEDVIYGTAITAPAEEPTREGYIFAGWEPEVGNMDAEGKTFTAKWTQNLDYCRVQSVERTTKGVYEEQRAVYKIKVAGSPVKIQFVHNVEGGTTWTYDRGTGAAEDYVAGDLTVSGLVGVTAYNAANEVVEFNSAETAYEVWTVVTVLTEGPYKVRAKVDYTSTSWESLDFAYEYDMVFDELTMNVDEMIISVDTAANTVKRGETLKVTFVTAANVNRLRLIKDNGDNTSTIVSYSAESSATDAITENEDGTLTWVLNIRFTYSTTATEDQQNWQVWFRAVGETGWTNSKKTFDVLVTKYAQSTSPSTQYDPFTVVSATAPETAVKAELTPITVITTSDITRIRLKNMDTGRTATYLATSTNVSTVDNGDGTTTWTINYRFSTTGAQSWGVQGRGSAWTTIGDATTFAITVN